MKKIKARFKKKKQPLEARNKENGKKEGKGVRDRINIYPSHGNVRWKKNSKI